MNTVTVTLTREQANRLEVYLLMSSKHRKGEATAWDTLATEQNGDGTPKFKNAKSNADWWRETDRIMEEVYSAVSKATMEETA